MPVRDLLMSAAGASGTPTYVDDVFSTYLYTGTGANQTITNNIDLTKGGMVWSKTRSVVNNNFLLDTVRGVNNYISSNQTIAQNGYGTATDILTSFNNNGFTLGADSTIGTVNISGYTYASWTFRKAPKFFDIVQYTGTGAAHSINHSLGSTPGCIMIKETSAINNWAVYHKGLNGGTTPQNYYTVLNTTAAQVASSAWWNNTAPTSTQFTVGTNATVNASGQTYIAYIFADQAGGFGATGTDSAIACGVYTSTGALQSINLGWEPQWILQKSVSTTGNWNLLDVMRGMSYTTGNYLYPNTSGTESAFGQNLTPTATGFLDNDTTPSGTVNIYIAIRRPNKPPTTGTSVFSPVVQGSHGLVTTGFAVDEVVSTQNAGGSARIVIDRLRGDSTTSYAFLNTSSSSAEATGTGYGYGLDNNTGITDSLTGAGVTCSYWNFRRAPTFFDEVCYTGTGTPTTINHNLTVAPQLLITKRRDSSVGGNWQVYNQTIGNTNYLTLNATNASGPDAGTLWNSTTPTSTAFSIGTSNNIVTGTYVAYLFATCAGVSYVGTYTGNGTGQSIACGFGSGGARFILIKRTDSTGDWYCYDSANGLTNSSSPYLTWNTTNAQTTGNNGVYASSGGFTLGATAITTTNIATATYIFLAIA